MGRPKGKKNAKNLDTSLNPQVETARPPDGSPNFGDDELPDVEEDQKILNQAIGGNIEGEDSQSLPSPLDDLEAQADSCLDFIQLGRNMIGVEVEIPDHIRIMWKSGYVRICQKYGMSFLGEYAAEISFSLASILLFLNTKANMPKDTPPEMDNVKEPISP